jgi:hypothetical protein
MIDYKGMNVSSDYIRCAVESVPEEVLGMESVASAFEYLGRAIDEYEDNWIDPDSEYYAESLAEAKREGRNSVLEILEQAEYRSKMFGTEIVLSDLIREVESE